MCIRDSHNPEFTMLEFYQAYATWEDLTVLTEELLVEVAREVTGGLTLQYGDDTIDLTPPWPRRREVDRVVAVLEREAARHLARHLDEELFREDREVLPRRVRLVE